MIYKPALLFRHGLSWPNNTARRVLSLRLKHVAVWRQQFNQGEWFSWFCSDFNSTCLELLCICSLQIILHVRGMAQVIEPFPKATHSPSAVAVQPCVEKSSMTPGCPSHLGQKIHPFQEQGKHNMKNTYLGKIVFQSKDYSTNFQCMYSLLNDNKNYSKTPFWQFLSSWTGFSITLLLITLNTVRIILRRL